MCNRCLSSSYMYDVPLIERADLAEYEDVNDDVDMLEDL